MALQMLLKSEEVAALLMADDTLVQRIFSSEWNAETGSYQRPPPGQFSSYKKMIKAVLLGEGETEYIAPNAARLANWLSGAFSVNVDRDTGYITLSSETTKPEFYIEIISQVVSETDKLLKERYIASAEQTMAFYQTKLAAARAREHREALARLIAQEDQKLMLASKGSYFVAEPLTTPTVSLYPTSPKASLVLALSVVLGSFFGAALVLIRKAIKT